MMAQWKRDREATLRRMWGEGQSASAIAKELGGVTRNAVVGKIHRMGLQGDAAPRTGTSTAGAEAKVRISLPRESWVKGA